MSAKRVPSSVYRFVPCVEGLEDRTVPSGNVQAVVLGGVLYVSGDDASDQIWVSGAGANNVVIRSLDGVTTINGQSAVFLSHITNGYHITLGNGDDQLLITDTRFDGPLFVSMGNGNDSLGISDDAHKGPTAIFTGNGNDDIILNASLYLKPISIDTGNGSDTVIANQISASYFGLSSSSSGTDYFENTNSNLPNAAITGFTQGVRPDPTVTLATSATSPTNTTPIIFSATTSDVTTPLTAADIGVSNGTVTQFVQMTPQFYLFAVTPTGSGTVSVAVLPGVIADYAGNVNAMSQIVSVAFDSVSPTVTVNPLTTNNTSPTITGTVNDSMAATVQVTVNGQTLNASVSGSTWSVAVPGPLANGTYPVTATATDAVGNSATSAPANLVVDTVAPTATFSSNQPNQTNASSVVVTIAFSKPVTGFTASGVSVSNGMFTFAQVDSQQYTLTISPSSDGNVTVNVAAGSATDDAGNTNAASSFTFVSDRTAPMVAIDRPPTTSGAVTGTATDATTGVASVQVAIYDPVAMMYWNGTMFVSSNNAIFVAATTSNSFSTWSVTVPAGTYNVTANATDGAGNSNAATQTNLTVS